MPTSRSRAPSGRSARGTSTSPARRTAPRADRPARIGWKLVLTTGACRCRVRPAPVRSGERSVPSGTHQNGRSNGSKQDLARDVLLDLVDDLGVGAAIPPERRLAAELGISRPTLRAAIEELVREGLLLRRHGSGTYVAEPKIALPLTMTSFSDDMRQRGMRPDSRVLSFTEEAAGAKLGARLKISPVDPTWAIRRLRLADEETMAI